MKARVIYRFSGVITSDKTNKEQCAILRTVSFGRESIKCSSGITLGGTYKTGSH